jgi:2-polyprenyl-3-methyl-5-hydroxy-6-metoxy-1,4-benzoquinol methylase
MKDEFIAQERWDQSYAQLRLRSAPANDPIRVWLEQHVPLGQGTCLELGCFPGSYLAVLAELGYEVHGIDRTPRVTPDLRDWMQHQGYRTGEFVRGDVFSYAYKRQYDVVCSFGLIEHFGRWSELVSVHARLVRDGGLLVITTPNFRGWFQCVLHQWLDSANLAEHNLDAMRPRRWADVVRPLGFTVVWCGYIGPFDFWVEPQPRPRWQAAVLKGLLTLKPVGRLLPDNVGAYAPYCGLLAQRRAA